VAAKPETRIWYRVALDRPGRTPLVVAASGEHLGQALQAAQDHVAGSWPLAVEVATGDGIPLGESVGKQTVVELGDSVEVPAFRWPAGVIPQLGGATTGGARGWVVHDDPELLVIEAQAEADRIVDLYLGLIERLPAADNLEVRVLDTFEDAPATDVWLTSRVNAKKILRFLDDYDTEIIDNGFIELNVYVRQHKATLRLTEHKTVVWLAEARALEADVTRWLGELDVPRIDALHPVSSGPHFHYRAAKSRDRKKLGQELFRQRLRRVAQIKRG
jgi:hypothetical protein